MLFAGTESQSLVAVSPCSRVKLVVEQRQFTALFAQ
jgi:hypothetical protein